MDSTIEKTMFTQGQKLVCVNRSGWYTYDNETGLPLNDEADGPLY